MISEEELQKALSASMPSILNGIKESFRDQAVREAQHKMSSLVSKAVEDFISDHIVPEIMVFLVENKEGMMSFIPELSNGITESLKEALLSSLKKKLENSWERQKIFESLFK